MDYDKHFILYVVILQWLVIFTFILWLGWKPSKIRAVNTYQHRFSDEDWKYAQKLSKLIDQQTIFYQFHFLPFYSSKNNLLKGGTVKLVNIQIDDKELTENELYEWIDKLEKRHIFDVTYIEWLFSYIDNFPKDIKENMILSFNIDLSGVQYEGIIKDIAELSSNILLPCRNIEIMSNLGKGDIESVNKKLKLMQSFGVKVNWNLFGQNIASLNMVLDFDYQSVTLSSELVEGIDQKITFKNFLKVLVELFKDKNILIRLPAIEDRRIVNQLIYLGIDECYYTQLTPGMTGEEYIAFCKKHQMLRDH